MTSRTDQLVRLIETLEDDLERIDAIQEIGEYSLAENQVSRLFEAMEDESSTLCLNYLIVLLSKYDIPRDKQNFSHKEVEAHRNFLWFAAALYYRTGNEIYRSVLKDSIQNPIPGIATLARNLVDEIGG